MTDTPEAKAPHLVTQVDGGVLIAQLNRPTKLNALSAETMRLFEEALIRFRDTPELKVLLIRATGRFFCSGADLRGGDPGEIRDTGSKIRENLRLSLNGMRRIYDEMEQIEKPIVVAHHAMCMGGGLELSLSCDFRLAAKSAAYAFPEGKFGSLPATNGVSRLTRIVGPHWARWLVMANKPMDADRALIAGLVHEVYPDESFEADALAFAHHLAEQNGEQMGTAKYAIELAADLGVFQASRLERLANSTLMLAPDFIETQRRYIAALGSGGRKG